MRTALQPIKPRKNILDYREYDREIRTAAEDVGTVIKESLDEVVADWKHRPSFQQRTTVQSDRVLIDVYPIGSNRQIWIYVDLGTRPHVIRPRTAKMLAFRTGYKPRTTAGSRPTYGGPGTATGPQVFARGVQHPGTKARGFTQAIMQANVPTLNEAVRDAIREAQR